MKALGYEAIDGYTTQTCLDEDQVGSQQYQIGDLNSNMEACSKLCDDKIDCEYFFFNDNAWCGLYRTCDFARTASAKGGNYRKRSNFLIFL